VSADWIIDLGPEGGDGGGGEIIAAGMPEDIAWEKRRYTGQFLKPCWRDAVWSAGKRSGSRRQSD
jgi:excinuclease UvrABC ATPase subunit